MDNLADTLRISTKTSSFGPKEYELGKELKRAFSIGIFGIAICIICVGALESWSDDNFAWGPFAIAVTLAITISLALIWWARHYRVRIDELGIHRRILFAWHSWPWELFASGDANVGNYRSHFTFPNMPRMQRRLSLELLGAENCEEVLAHCLDHWSPPKQAEVPNRIEIVPGALAFRLFTSRRFFADAKGVTLITRATSKVYAWRDVQRCVFFRISHQHEEFLDLILEFSDQRFVLVVDRPNNVRLWRGPASDVLSLFLKQHVDSGRIVNAALAGPPLSVAEADFRIQRLKASLSKFRRFQYFLWIFCPVGVALTAWWYWPRNAVDLPIHFLKIGLTALLVGVFYILLPAFASRQLRDPIEDLHVQRNRLL